MIHGGLVGKRQMRMAAWEAAQSSNHKPGRCGVSPAVRLFGQKVKLSNELYERGEPVGWHPEVADDSSELALRLRIRQYAAEAAAKYDAEQAVARAVAARSRPAQHFEPGTKIFFYRSYATRDRDTFSDQPW